MKTLKIENKYHKALKKEASEREITIEALTKEVLEKGMEGMKIAIE